MDPLAPVTATWHRGRGLLEQLQPLGGQPLYRCSVGGMALYASERWDAEQQLCHLLADSLPFRILYVRFRERPMPQAFTAV